MFSKGNEKEFDKRIFTFIFISTYIFKQTYTAPLSLTPSQVSHHPPAAAHHVISERGWTLRQEITVASKFRGKYLSIMPLGKSNQSAYMSYKCRKHKIGIRTINYCGLISFMCCNHTGYKRCLSLSHFSLLFVVFPARHDSRHFWEEQQSLHMEESHYHSAQHHCGKVMDRPGERHPLKAPTQPSSTCLHIPFFFCLSPVGGDRRGESHYWRPLPPEVCTLQLLLQRRGQEGEEPIVLTFPP